MVKLLTSAWPAALAFTAALARDPMNATSSNATPEMSNGTPTVNLTDAIEGLKALKFNTLASLLQKNSENASKILASTTNVTFLAPTDQAFSQAGHSFSQLSLDAQWALLQYHALHGNYTTGADSTFFNASEHSIARTFLNNKTYADLGSNTKPQVVVLSRNAQGFPVVVETNTNVSFVSKNQTMALGSFRLAAITKVLSIPGKLSEIIGDLGLKALAMAAKASNKTAIWDAAAGVTVFAPTDAAFTTATNSLKALNATQVTNVLGGHVLNGTVLYSSDLAKTAAMAKADPSKMNADGNIILANLTASAGQNITLAWLKSGSFAVISGNFTAKITRTDSLFKGGVVHTIDTVLVNTDVDPMAAANAYKKYSEASNSTASTDSTSNADGDSGGILNGTTPTDGTSPVNASLAGAAVDFGLVSLLVGALSLAGGMALLI